MQNTINKKTSRRETILVLMVVTILALSAAVAVPVLGYRIFFTPGS